VRRVKTVNYLEKAEEAERKLAMAVRPGAVLKSSWRWRYLVALLSFI
jgi:hypothetical protein